jgi:DNA-directed RNA polymerase specialized sigma24 family protein
MSSRPEQATEHHSLSEVREAIVGLSEADWTRLMTYARGYCSKRIRGSVFEPEDLLQEALIRTLKPTEKRRHWKKGIPFLQHVDQALRSISSDQARKDASRTTSALPEDDELETHDKPREEFDAHEEQVLAMFDEKPLARDIVLLQEAGLSASAIQKELGISKTDYDSTCRWIRRRRAEFL